MSGIATILRKLRGRSVAELRVRAGQSLAAAIERASLPADGRPLDDAAAARLLAGALHSPRGEAVPGDAAALLEAFRSWRPAFFPAFDDPAATMAAVREGWSGAERAIVDRADRALAGRFDVLGLTGLSYGDPVNWHLDPTAGKEAPRVHWSRVPYLDPAAVGDHKVVWEVNRHQHLVTLGQAYWLTGDERYAAAVGSQLVGWMDANPPKIGINWASNLEVGFRAISWLWALRFLRHSPSLTATVYGRLLAYLCVSARHLERYLSTYFSPNTHLTGEALALLFIGTEYPEFRESERWRRTGWDVLTGQLAVQVRPDGVYFEQASYYHRYTVDFYLHAVTLRERNGYDVPAHVHAKLQQLLTHLAYLSRPDGRIALVGDDDGGRLVMLTTRHAADARATLALGAARYGRADLAAVAEGASDELAWIGGREAVERFAALDRAAPLAPSRAFADGGYFTMRDGWGAGASYLLIDCGPHGAMNCGHAHADVLGLELAVAGRPVLVDSGTYSYPGPERNAFRSGEAHNTTTLDGESSSVPGTPFTWRSVAGSTTRAWAADEAFAYFDGEHDGYRRLAAPATVGRAVLAVHGRLWVVADRVESTGPHTLRAHYHAAPGLAVRRVAPHAVGVAGEGNARPAPGLQIVVPPPPGGPLVEVSLSEGWASPAYAARERSAGCTVTVVTPAGASELLTFLLPLDGSGTPYTMRELPAQRGRIFALAGRDGGGLVARGDEGGAGGAELDTDGRWVWVSPAGSAPQEFIMIAGSRLLVAGDELVHLTTPAGWVAGRRVGGAWRLRHGALDPHARE